MPETNTPPRRRSGVKNKNLLLVSLLVYVQLSLSIVLIVLLYTYKSRYFDKPYNECASNIKNKLENVRKPVEIEVWVDGRYKVTQARNMIENAGLKVTNVVYSSYEDKNIFKTELYDTTEAEYKICELSGLPSTKGMRILAATNNDL